MKEDKRLTAEQVTPLILALLDATPIHDLHQVQPGKDKLFIDGMEWGTAYLLVSLQITFRYDLPSQPGKLTPPRRYQLLIGYDPIMDTLKPVLVTLTVQVQDEWVHQPLNNVAFVVAQLHKY